MRNILKRSAPAALAALLVAIGISNGCGWVTNGELILEKLHPRADGGGEEDGGEEDGGYSADTGPWDGSIGDVGGEGLPGLWAVRLVQNGSIVLFSINLTVNDLFLAEIGGDQASIKMRFCNQVVDIKNGTTGRTETPEALKTALYNAPLTVTFDNAGVFAATNAYWLWAIEGMANPLTDPLPTMENPAGSFDQDVDDHPGDTMHVLEPLGDRYMVRRAVWTYDPGTISADQQWITGNLVFRIDENALGATNPLLLTVAPITPKTSKYQLRRVDSSFTCKMLDDGWREIFKNAPK